MANFEPSELMRLAIAKAQAGMAAGQMPFGCAIAVGERLLAVEHNTVWSTTDVTAHAEINALRTACRELGDVHLAGAVVATTCEPCPMCAAALLWARVDTIYFGASIADAGGAGLNQLALPAAELLRSSSQSVRLVGGLLAPECRALFAGLASRPKDRGY